MKGKLAACGKSVHTTLFEERERDETPATPPLPHSTNDCHPNPTTSISMDISMRRTAPPAPAQAILARLARHASPKTHFGIAAYHPNTPYPHPIPTLDSDSLPRPFRITISYCLLSSWLFLHPGITNNTFTDFPPATTQRPGVPAVAATRMVVGLDERAMA